MGNDNEARFIVTDSDGNFLDLKKLPCRICLHNNKPVFEIRITETIVIHLYKSEVERMLKRCKDEES